MTTSSGVAPVDHQCFADTQATHKEIELLDMLFASTPVAVEAVGAPVPEQLSVCLRLYVCLLVWMSVCPPVRSQMVHFAIYK